jgi:hypothetical protein
MAADRSPTARLRDPRRLAAIALVGVVGGIAAAVLWVHNDRAGADAYAYWQAVHAWLAGRDPYQPSGPWWPYAYPPWLLPAFLPWAVLPWSIAWPLWRATNVVLLALTFRWAYRRRQLATAIAVLLLAIPLGLVIDSGNVTLVCAYALWAAQLSGPRLAGFLWALATAVKWFPAAFWLILPGRARRWGLAFAAVAVLLSVLTWAGTVEQIRVVLAAGVPRATSIMTTRVDHLAILWAAIPWLWRRGLPGGATCGRLPCAPDGRQLGHERRTWTRLVRPRRTRSVPRPCPCGAS